MKKFLLTWYGITDFRASLGFENTEGPIAGALAAEAYSDVVVLCYTRIDEPADEAEAQASFDTALAAIHAAGQHQDWKVTGEFVSRFANTPAAHAHFANWLKGKVEAAGGQTDIWFKSEKLRELNDTEGIYACAMRALDFAAKASGEKLVTLYLSPGTPVMAFVWSLAALRYPDLKKRLIVSPVIGKPPEAISLPAEWLERHNASQTAARGVTDGFDVTFHLFGEQRMPSLLGIRQFESKKHVFVNSKEYPATCIKAFLDGRPFEELPVSPWDARAVHEKILHHAKPFAANARIGINLTGGTKMMFTGALSAARALGAVPFYFDSRNRRVTYVDSHFQETVRPIDSVEDFLLLNGDGLKVAERGVPSALPVDRHRLTDMLWKNHTKIARCYRKLREWNDAFKPFVFENEHFYFELRKDASAVVRGFGLDLRFQHWPDFAKYLTGGWFEEYVYAQFKPYADKGVIKDLRINVRLQLDHERAPERLRADSASYNELDVVFTDGYSLYIVECKAGDVTQEQVMKLQNLVRFYGGVEGRGILASCFPPSTDAVRKKVADARLSLCSGKWFPEQLDALMLGIAERTQSMRSAA
ncbi:Card1-like endonuclease domain-containing protein [Massilia cellulosiltytica]|uniref:Card1-like endonuclease domain-containing protein n=1 Tax=Massilia cellulosiltytica TaxID=2683234 RepID=UPI0039B6B33E